MPVTSYVRGAQGWTPLDHKPAVAATTPRGLPVGDIHAMEPTAGTAVCSGETVQPDVTGRSFEAWAPGTCSGCSEAIAPRPADTPPA